MGNAARRTTAAGRNAFGVTLPAEHASKLREEAAKLEIRPTTLAGKLLQAALDGGGPAHLQAHLLLLQQRLDELFLLQERLEQRVDQRGEAILRAERGAAKAEREAAKTRRDLYNGIVMLLRTTGGMGSAEVNSWAKEFLSRD